MSVNSTPHTIQVGPPSRPSRRREPHRLPSWGLKTAMAVSGALWAFFVAVHLFGNLKIFAGAEAFNGYSAWLRVAFYPLLPEESVLWALRVALVVGLVVHVGCAALLWARARRARGPHRARIRGARSVGAWLMPVTGIGVLAFLVIHLLDLTLGTQPIAASTYAHADAYANLVASFQRPWSATFYVAIMVLLSVHLAKGFTTMAADLGVMGRRWRAALVAVGGLLALAVLLGNGAIPILVQLGVIA